MSLNNVSDVVVVNESLAHATHPAALVVAPPQSRSPSSAKEPWGALGAPCTGCGCTLHGAPCTVHSVAARVLTDNTYTHYSL